MKKFAICLITCLISQGYADISRHFHKYQRVECSFEEKANSVHHKSGRTHPHMPVDQGVSSNWSGYAAETSISHPTNGSVNSVSGSWVVPALKGTSNPAYTAIWVGIDGFSSTTVEQLGTSHDWSNGHQVNYAWYEMYPNPSMVINGFPLHVGDVIEAEVQYLGSNEFQLSMINHTTGVYTTINKKSKVAKRSSAEWIVEAPYSNQILPLSDFQQVAFTNCQTTINNVAGGINAAGWQAENLTMESGRTIKAATSAVGPDNESFLVTWYHE